LREGVGASDGAIINAVDKQMVCDSLGILAPELYDKLLFMPECSLDFDIFREKIVDRIEELIDGDDKTPRKIRLELPVTIESNE